MANYTVALMGGIASGKSEVERCFRAQATREERLAVADDAIATDGPLKALEPALQ